MRRTRTPTTRAAAAITATVLGAAAVLAGAAPAQAASARWVKYDGKSINMRPVPAKTVELTAYSPARADSAEFLLDGRVVGRDETVDEVGGRYEATADVDLSGTSGTTRLVVRYTTGERTSTFYKWFKGVDPDAPAKATSSARWIAYDGKSINMRSVPAEVVELTAYSPDGADSAEFLLDGRVVGRDDDVEEVRGRHEATADVDLSGTSGTTRLFVRYTSGSRTSTFYKWFKGPEAASARPTTVEDRSVPVDGTVRGPGSRNTGVPQGTTLTPHAGRLDLRTDGEVVDGLDVAGCVRVFAKDVTIRNSRIRCTHSFAGSLAVKTMGGSDRLTLEDVEIDGGGTTDVCVGWTKYTLRRANVHGCADGARFGHRVTIEGSWIHDLARVRTLHPDAVQTTSASDVVIRGNTLDAYNAARKDYGNAAIMIGSETGTRAVVRLLVEGNHLNGGNYTVNVRSDTNDEGVVLRDNTFGSVHRYGPARHPGRVSMDSGNTYADGTSVTTQRAA